MTNACLGVCTGSPQNSPPATPLETPIDSAITALSSRSQTANGSACQPQRSVGKPCSERVLSESFFPPPMMASRLPLRSLFAFGPCPRYGNTGRGAHVLWRVPGYHRSAGVEWAAQLSSCNASTGRPPCSHAQDLSRDCATAERGSSLDEHREVERWHPRRRFEYRQDRRCSDPGRPCTNGAAPHQTFHVNRQAFHGIPISDALEIDRLSAGKWARSAHTRRARRRMQPPRPRSCRCLRLSGRNWMSIMIAGTGPSRPRER